MIHSSRIDWVYISLRPVRHQLPCKSVQPSSHHKWVGNPLLLNLLLLAGFHSSFIQHLTASAQRRRWSPHWAFWPFVHRLVRSITRDCNTNKIVGRIFLIFRPDSASAYFDVRSKQIILSVSHPPWCNILYHARPWKYCWALTPPGSSTCYYVLN
jgi:hypothetical protein